MRVIQDIEIKEWPLTKLGDAKFFGYVVAMGLLPYEWNDDSKMFRYVDFAYNDSYERFLLPDDDKLRNQLEQTLRANLDSIGNGGIYGKVWIRLGPAGYSVQLP